MFRWLTVTLVLGLAWAVGGMAQGPSGKAGPKDTGKGEPPKVGPKDKGEPPKVGPKDKGEPAKKIPLDKMKLPRDVTIVVVEDLKEAMAMFPTAWVLSPEAYQKLLDRIATLEAQLKAEKRTPHACKLSGKLDGDVVAFEAEFTFATEKPNTSVALGLQGAHLTKEGDLDGQVPRLEFGDDGFVVQVESAGAHRLTLSFEAPAVVRRTGTAGGSERGFDVGLPGAA